jgi:hypothetical protein
MLYRKTVTLETSHIIRKVLQSETWSLSGGVHHWFKRWSTMGEGEGARTRDDCDHDEVKTAQCAY